jgi:hypothetical protein
VSRITELSTGSSLGVELFDHHIEFGALRAQTVPVIAVVVPLGAQFFDALAELLDPGEILDEWDERQGSASTMTS